MICKVDPAELVFYNRHDAVESKMAREMPRFLIETAVGGRESRMRDGGCGLGSRYVRAMFAVIRNVMVARRCRRASRCPQTPYNGGLKVAFVFRWWRRFIGECHCRLLVAEQWWRQGGLGSR